MESLIDNLRLPAKEIPQDDQKELPHKLIPDIHFEYEISFKDAKMKGEVDDESKISDPFKIGNTRLCAPGNEEDKDRKNATVVYSLSDYCTEKGGIVMEAQNATALVETVLTDFPKLALEKANMFVDVFFGSKMRKFLTEWSEKLSVAQESTDFMKSMSWNIYYALLRKKGDNRDETVYADETTMKPDGRIIIVNNDPRDLLYCEHLTLEECINDWRQTLEMLKNACKGSATSELDARVLLEFANMQGVQWSQDKMHMERRKGFDNKKLVNTLDHHKVTLYGETDTQYSNGWVRQPRAKRPIVRN